MKKYFLPAILVLLTCCSEKLMEKPENLIARDKMVTILKDLAVVNAAKTTNVGLMRENNVKPMDYIFKKHGIDSVQFVESDKYYASLPVQYESIYREVESRLEKEQNILKKAKEVRDSLKLLETERKREMDNAKKQKIKDSLAQTSGKKMQ